MDPSSQSPSKQVDLHGKEKRCNGLTIKMTPKRLFPASIWKRTKAIGKRERAVEAGILAEAGVHAKRIENPYGVIPHFVSVDGEQLEEWSRR
ncbi:hypothetical protein HPP92_003612 [Vanilla planifolia]|uniref:Uncharacterized protein n=1 Tax=Vanilla planifolia TaxID=51239 RepID=A0A835RV77_VANPL|nr:hypothetical protein HPP92_003612 [Vanilla planifolia]